MKAYHNNDKVFTKEDSTSFYLLGVYMTDGCVMGNRIQLTSKDKEWLEIIRDLISPTRPLNGPSIGRTVYDLKFRSEDVAAWLDIYGCTPHKSKTLTIDSQIPNKYIRDFVRGVVDGDGSISLLKGKSHLEISMSITSASKKFLIQLQALFPDEIKSHLYFQKKRKHIRNGVVFKNTTIPYVLRIYGSSAQKLLGWIYYPDHKISMPRKNKLAERSLAIPYHKATYSARNRREELQPTQRG